VEANSTGGRGAQRAVGPGGGGGGGGCSQRAKKKPDISVSEYE
jgi:hypothetical protein